MPCGRTNAALILLCWFIAAPVCAPGDDKPAADGEREYAALFGASPEVTAAGDAAAGPANAAIAPSGTSVNPLLGGANPEPAGSAPGPADPASSAAGKARTPGGDAPAPWIWQGSDDIPVQVKTHRPQRLGFNPLSDSGLNLRLGGNAYLGYSSESQNASPAYTNFNGGLNLNANGFVYNPRFLSYVLRGSYDRTDTGFANRDSGGNGLNYGATVSFLQATPAPFSFTYMQNSKKLGGTLSVPFSFRGRSLEMNGLVRKLPVDVSYRLGGGSNGTLTADGHDLGYRYRNGDVAISRKWRGFDIRIADDYLRSRSIQTLAERGRANGFLGLSNTNQTNNNLRWSLDKNLGPRVAIYADGNQSRYKFESINTQSTDATVTSFGAGLHWTLSSKLDASFSGTLTRNAVNILQLLSQSTGTPLPNPLPGVSVLDTTSRSLRSAATYRASTHWTFGAETSHNAVALPAALAASAPATGQGLTNRVLSNTLSTAYTRHLWKFDYNGGVTGGLQNFSYSSGKDGLGKIFSVSNAISGGDERSLGYGVRYTIDRTDNPVFFSLLNTHDRVLDVHLARRERFVRLNGSVGYSQREIDYAGSTQHLNGLNFMVAASLSSLNVTASRYTSDTNQRFFGLLSPLGSGTGITPLPPGLLTPLVLASSTSDAIAASWRPRQNLQIDSRYTRFAFTVTGTSGENRETWLDDSAQYHPGRFDIVGGFIHATGHTATSDRRMNRFYFMIKFPFQLW